MLLIRSVPTQSSRPHRAVALPSGSTGLEISACLSQALAKQLQWLRPCLGFRFCPGGARSQMQSCCGQPAPAPAAPSLLVFTIPRHLPVPRARVSPGDPYPAFVIFCWFCICVLALESCCAPVPCSSRRLPGCPHSAILSVTASLPADTISTDNTPVGFSL